MEIATVFDLVDAVVAGQRLVTLRNRYQVDVDRVLREISTNVIACTKSCVGSRTGNAAARKTALKGLLAATEPLGAVTEKVAQCMAVEHRLQATTPSARSAAQQLFMLAQVPLPEDLVSDKVGRVLKRLQGESAESVGARLALSMPAGKSVRGLAENRLRSTLSARVWALHALMLTEIATARVTARSADHEEVANEESFTARIRQLIDAARAECRSLSDGKATPRFSSVLSSLLHATERWWVQDAVAQVKRASVLAASLRGTGGADRAAKHAARIYDAARTILALDAGIRKLLESYSFRDTAALAEAGARATQRAWAKDHDIARPTISEIATAREGTAVEVSGVVEDATYVVGGNHPRSVLELGKRPRPSLRVLVPFRAVDSFGIIPGVWVQARGVAYPEGKDGLEGPVVMVSRIRRQEASASNFGDWLVWLGRTVFELRPGGLDIIAGRLASERRTLREITLASVK